MKKFLVSQIHDLHFGRHSGISIDGLGAPFVVLYGENESGKSTLAEFLTWAIGGPWRSFALNSDAFRIASGDIVYGGLSSLFGDETLDIDAKFRLNVRGTPKDMRTGIFGARQIDETVISSILGGVKPEDFALIYRLYGGSLGDIGSGKEFSSLFSSFAMGSANPVENPREALAKLRSEQKAIKDKISTATKSRREVEKQIKTALQAPDEIAKLESEITDISDQIVQLGLDVGRLNAEVVLIDKVLSGQVHLSEKRNAESDLQVLSMPSEEMAKVVLSLPELETAIQREREADKRSRELRQNADSAIASCGISEESLKGKTFSPVERVELQSVVTSFMQAQHRVSTIKEQIVALEDEIKTKTLNIDELCERVDLASEHLSFLDSISPDLPDLSERAVRWLEQTNSLIETEGKLAGARVENYRTTEDPVTSVGDSNVPPEVFALGFLLVAIAALWKPVLGLVVAIALTVGVIVYRSHRHQKNVPRAIASDNSQIVADYLRDVENIRYQLESHHEMLRDGLGPIAGVLKSPDVARSRLAVLVNIADLRAEVAKLNDHLVNRYNELNDAVSVLDICTSEIKGALNARGIPMSLLDDRFDMWLARYESAVNAVIDMTKAASLLEVERSRIKEILEPISDRATDQEIPLIIDQVRDAADQIRMRREIEERIRVATGLITAANLDSDEVHSLMQRYPTDSDLESRRNVAKLEAASAQSERDRLLGDQADLNSEYKKRTGAELMPQLNLLRGEFDEAIEEWETELEGVNVALSTLSSVIDSFERDNQDPVVTLASKLIEQVVPDWGTVVFSRDDKGEPLIERVDSSGRLSEKQISDGGRALLYLALRLAFASKDAEKRGVALPVVCDDPLVHFDDNRSASALGLLADFSKSHQVVLFTCESRTRDLASSLGAHIVEI